MDLAHTRALLRRGAQHAPAERRALPVERPALFVPDEVVREARPGHLLDGRRAHALEGLPAGKDHVGEPPEGENIGAGPGPGGRPEDELRRRPRQAAPERRGAPRQQPREPEVHELRPRHGGFDKDVGALEVAVDDLRALGVEVAQGGGHVQEQLVAAVNLGVRVVCHDVAVEVGALDALHDEQHLALQGLHDGPVEERDTRMPCVAENTDFVGNGDEVLNAGILATARHLHRHGRAMEPAAHDNAKGASPEDLVALELEIPLADEPVLLLAKRVHPLQAAPQFRRTILRRALQPSVDVHAVKDAARVGGLR
mmetsp:Transcript_39956/g.95575  ORF Transcript_39956/g.95575 Transcript_39956/m.95575 type:complete len:312 (-) Transcript_39956:1149-2084(-)